MNFQELFRYGVAGVLAFATDFSLLYVLTEYLGMHYLVSNVFGYFCGLLVAYALNSTWVFTEHRFENRWVEFGIFAGIVIAGLAISEGVMLAWVESAEGNYIYAKLIATFFVACFNFVARKFWLFAPAAVPSER
ncbi:MAG: GtrA family protein [Halieaceae bacterium]|jgi:putative flippase GtrA|nr:GtrA family protein [Halieaceae bacterium]